ncbi:hypothetical protein CLOM_g4959 [Closterium sp. NIES-68]|nr:hypothetical protein CLOM_g4959 [Closterium sp. NIES-68]GJP85460.1 hypothetical protein CLOP_g15560 [Closterium sp. NIES-67]
MEADLTNMIDIEIQCNGGVLGTVVIDKEWSLSAVRTEIFAVFPGTAPEEFEFWIHGPGEEPKKISHRREPHISAADFMPPKELEIRALDD